MRKLILALSLLTFSFGGVAFAVDLPSNPGMVKRITGATQGTPTRVYKLVRFASNVLGGSVQTISAGEAVVYDTISDDGITIRRTTTSADGAFAGIAVTSIVSNDNRTGTSADDDAGNENWGYIIVHGPTTALVTGSGINGANNASVGDPVITSSDSGAVTTFVGTTSLGSGGNEAKRFGNKGGFFMDAPTDQSNTIDVFINLE